MSRDPVWRRYRDLLRPRTREDADDEVRFHLEMRADEARRAGRSAGDADAEARRRFGDVGGVLAELHAIDDARRARRSRGEWIADVARDVRVGARSLRRAPAFAVTACVTIGIAIAATTTVFSFVDTLLLEPLPYTRPAELVDIRGGVVGSLGEAAALRERTRSFADFAVYGSRVITLDDGSAAERLDGFSITPNLLTMLGVRPMIGSGFAADASQPGNGSSLLLSYGLWLRRFGGDPNVIGRRVNVDGTPFTVLGVMPANFHFPTSAAEFWTPLTIDRANTPAMWAWPGGWWVARLRPGLTAADAQREVARVAPAMRRLNPMWDPGADYGKRMAVRPFQQSLVGAARPALLLLSGSVVVVLLIACVNVANLLLARATARERELTVRAALGGGRARLVRQLLTESLVLARAGGALGLVLAAAGVRWAAAAMPPEIPRIGHIGMRASVYVFAALVTIFTGVAFGMLPALRATAAHASPRAAGFGRSSGPGVGHHRVTAALVLGQVALAVVLAITAGLLARSFAELRDIAPGFHTAHLVVARVSPPAAAYAERARTDALYERILTRARALPGVASAAVVDRLPIAGPVYGIALRVQGRNEDVRSGNLPWSDHFQTITPDYLRTFGIPVLRGRGFTTEDRAGAQPVALVSRSLAARLWPNEDPLGKQIGYPFPSPWITVVGVVPDVRLDSLRDTSSLATYVPYAQRWVAVRTSGVRPDMSIALRVVGDAAPVERALPALVADIDRGVAVTQVRTMDDVLSQSIAKPRFTLALVGAFALTALLLGAVGIYGVMAYLVSQRAHEMGVRLALGATARDVVLLVVGRGLRLAIIGGVAGAAGSLGATHWLRSLLYAVSPTDPLTFVTVPALFVLIAAAASAAPARRAAKSDPVRSLRAE
jgi:predicted permease